MNIATLREKLINNSNIRNYFLDKNYKNKTYSQLFKKNIKGRGRLNITEWISLFVSSTAIFTLLNPFNLSFISNNSESLLFSLFVLSSIMMASLMLYCSKDSGYAEEDDPWEIFGFSILGLFGATLLGVSYNREYFIIFGVFLSGMPLFKNAWQWIFATIKSFMMKEKDLEINMKEEDHQELVKHLNRGEMILFLKNFMKYSDLPFENMEKKRIEEIQKRKKEEEIMCREEKIENYTDMLFKNKR